MARYILFSVVAFRGLVSAAAAHPLESPLAGRWQYIQHPDKEGEVLDLFVRSGRWSGIMNGLERAGDHGLFYYVVIVENLAVEPDGRISFEIGKRSFFTQRPLLSRLGGEGDAGFSRSRMRFAGRLEGRDMILRCGDDDGSCPDRSMRFTQGRDKNGVIKGTRF